MRRPLIALIALTAAACGSPETAARDEAIETPEAAAPVMESMTYDEFSAAVEPGLGCAFSAGDQTLFVATAEARPSVIAEGVVKTGGRLLTVRATSAGGYEALARGGAFAGDEGVRVEVTRGGGEGAAGEIETVSWPAVLTVRMQDGPAAEHQGQWSCGS